MDPYSFDPFNNMICSRVERLRFGIGSFSIEVAMEWGAMVGPLLLFPSSGRHVLVALICSALSSKSRHLRFNCVFLPSSDVNFNWRMQCSTAAMVAAKSSSFDLEW